MLSLRQWQTTEGVVAVANEAVNFEVPKSIDTLLDRLASMYGSLTAYVAMRAGYESEDIPILIFRVAELYGLTQALGVIFGSRCEREVRKALDVYKELFEEALDYVFGDIGNPDLLKDLMDGLFKLKVGTFMLITGCAGLPAVVKAPPEEGGDSSGQ
jgi:hypothetical protein